mgnify:CR=1 FL=1
MRGPAADRCLAAGHGRVLPRVGEEIVDHPGLVDHGEAVPLETTLTPVYPATAGLPQAWLRKRIDRALRDVDIVEVGPRDGLQSEPGVLPTATKVEFIEPNYLYRTVTTPSDPEFYRLWGLQNTGQTGGLPGADIDATLAWDVFTGTNILVAITDTLFDDVFAT